MTSESSGGEGEDERAEEGGVKTSPEHSEAIWVAAAGGDSQCNFVLEDSELLGGVSVHGEPHTKGFFGGGGLKLGDWKEVAGGVGEDKANVVLLYGRVPPSFGGPGVVNEPKPGFIRAYSTSGDVEDSTPLVEDEHCASHEGGRGVLAGGICHNDFGVADVRDGRKGSVGAGNGGDKVNATVILV